MLALLLVVAAQAAEPQPFTARLLGSTIGVGSPCVLIDAPPHGAWTVVYEVTDPGQTALAVGRQLCEVVHSPSMHLRAAADAAALPCLALPGEPVRFSCGDHPPPTPGLQVLTADGVQQALPDEPPPDEAPRRWWRRRR